MSDRKPTRREYLGESGALVVGQSVFDDDCGLVDRLLRNCPDSSTTSDGASASGDSVDLLVLRSLASHPDDADIGEGNVALYAYRGDLYKKPYGRDPVQV